MKSTNGVNTSACYLFRPDPSVKPRAILQIVHGMTEKIMKYEKFAKFFADQGFIVCGNDHLGHGRTARPGELGYFGKGNTVAALTKDVFKLTRLIRKRYPGLPHILIGHSMGSFIAREVLYRYGENYDAAIICGTSGKNKAVLFGKAAIALSTLLHGDEYRSEIIDTLALGDLKFRSEFTNNGFRTIAQMIDDVNRRKWFEKVPKDMPYLFLSGENDPLGNHGKGIEEIRSRLIAAGRKNVSVMIYPDGPHDMLNGCDNRGQVWWDIHDWLRDAAGI